MLLGIAGMVIITATNTIFDLKKNQNIEIGRNSQLIAQIILQSMMLEEQFIATSDATKLTSITTLQEEIQTTLNTIKNTTDNNEIIKVVKEIDSSTSKHAKILTKPLKTWLS